ncbi:MAG: Calx-beta domain-containing protein, partial [Pyrinomonadaceae bacterium]
MAHNCDPSGNGEGTTPFGPGAVGVVTDSNGNAGFMVTIPTPLSPGHVITSTATDTPGNTSEFSPCDAIGGRPAFSATNFVISEDGHSIQITVNRTGSSSQPVAVNYATSDITASERSDYTTALGTLRFAAGETTKTFDVLISLDSFIEGTESAALTLSNPTGGAVLGVPSAATVQINDAVPSPVTNPIDEVQNFVRQHYHDFLSREPDAAGLDFWTREITDCGSDLACTEIKRINVSAAFFLSIEFQETGFFAYRMFKSAYGDATSPNVSIPVPIIRFHEFIK